MPLIVLLPLLAWLLAVLLAAEPVPPVALPFPQTAWAAVVLTALLAALMRQWSWLYWVALLAGGYQAASAGLGAPETAQALAFVLPGAYSVLAVLLALAPRPPPWTLAGLPLLLAAAAAPLLLPALPPDYWYGRLALPADWLQAAAPWPALALPGALAACWLPALVLLKAPASRWGEPAAGLALALLPLLAGQPAAAGWTVLAGSLSILLALASQMLRLAYYDELTRLPQRRALLAHLRRLGRRSAVAMLDVDHFKRFNDRYGHDIGDQVLRLLGGILAKESGFRAYRYGGEEFTLVFNHDRQAAIEESLERVRERVAAYPFRIRGPGRPKNPRKGEAGRGRNSGGKRISVTVSLGCALRRDGEIAQALIKRADTLLYRAKKAGRNRAVVKA